MAADERPRNAYADEPLDGGAGGGRFASSGEDIVLTGGCGDGVENMFDAGFDGSADGVLFNGTETDREYPGLG